MKKYEILEHRADLKIKVFAKTKKELFENAMIGMFKAGNYQIEENSKEIKRKVSVQSSAFDLLLIDFLSEILYLTETKKEIYSKVNFKKFSDSFLEGLVFGKKLKKIGIIKAVTYHNLKIKKRKDGLLEAEILFDI